MSSGFPFVSDSPSNPNYGLGIPFNKDYYRQLSEDVANKERDARYKRAIEAGMSEDFARQYANSLSYPTNNRVNSKAYRDEVAALNADDQQFFKNLLNASREQTHNSEEDTIARRRAVGINDDLNGGSSLPSNVGEAAQIDDETLGSPQRAAALQNAYETPFKVAETLMSSLAGVMNLANSGVNLGRGLFQMDLDEISSVFQHANDVADLGSFLPQLGINYSQRDRQFVSEDGHAIEISGMSRNTFDRLISKNGGVRSVRARRLLWDIFKSMTSPKAINEYKSSLNKNIELNDSTAAIAAKGIGKYGYLTRPDKEFGVPSLYVNSRFGKSELDSEVYDKYVQACTDIELIGLQVQRNELSYNNDYWKNARGDLKAFNENNQNRIEYQMNEIRQHISDRVISLVKTLSQDAKKGSMLANYLLVNMMSGEFNGVGAAAYMQGINSAPDPKSFKDFFNQIKDFTMMSGAYGLNLLHGLSLGL